MTDDFMALRERYRRFTDERGWRQFHDPKSLILALVGEVGELAELFQWLPADEAAGSFANAERKQRAEEEVSDVLIYLLAIADSLGIDLVSAAHRKMDANELRFPADAVHSVAPVKE